MAKTLKDFLNERQLGPMVVKNPDEQKFIDKHVIAKVADRNGNDDELFKGSKVKFADRKKDRKGYNPGEDEEVYEELKGNQHKIDANKNGKVDAHDFKLLRKKKKVAEEAEQIDELSTPTLQSYRKKARAQGNAIVDKMKMGGGDWSKDQKDTKTLRKRAAGAQASGKQLVKRGESLKTESVNEDLATAVNLGTMALGAGSIAAQHVPYGKSKRSVGQRLFDRKSLRDKIKRDIEGHKKHIEWSKDPTHQYHKLTSPESVEKAKKSIANKTERLKQLGYVKSLSVKEGVSNHEQIDELSRKTLGSYAKKAKDQMSRSDTIAGREMGSRYDGQRPSPNERKHNQRADKRYRGLDMAISKLAKEEVELGEAMNSYDRYTSTHGDVMKMMKSIGDHLAAHKKAAVSHSSPYDKKKGPHWGHVGDIDSIHSRLKDIHDQLAQQGEYAKVHEEVEDLEELSKNTLHSYIEKSAQDVHNQAYRAGKKEGGEGKYDSGKILKSLTRQIGISKATRKLAGKAKVNANEEVELDEKLTAKTPMGTYIKDFQKSDAPQFKGKSQKKRQVMAIAAKLSAERGGKPLNKEERLLANLGDISESHKRTLLDVFSKLNEDNQRKFMTACETPEGVEQMLDFAIQNRGE